MSSENGHAPHQSNGVGPHGDPSPSPAEDAVLSVRDVSKCYHIYSKPRDRLKQAVARRFKTYYRPFWALKDINFEVKRGEAVGIIGRNGSGKSTLLQIIAGTLTPTEGEVVIRGRVAALLELGSGFNPEFTGRDNVFLNGAILGIPRKEMERRFDDIASFADIGDFLDQPVKHYSSGMHARLAFSVAISVDPDILILDEILSVGDMGFQQKCVARMKKLLESGVTLLFVSHAPDAVKSLCRKGLFLAEGRAAYWGSAEEAVNRYFGHVREAVYSEVRRAQPASPLAKPLEARTDVRSSLRYGSGHAQVSMVRLLDADGRPVQAYQYGERVTLEVTIHAVAEVRSFDVAFVVRDAAGVDLFGTGASDERIALPSLRQGQRATVRFHFANVLRAGSYGVTVTLTQLPDRVGDPGVTLDNIDACATFLVVGLPTRAVHYKFFCPATIEVSGPVPDGEAAEPAEPAGFLPTHAQGGARS